MYDIASQLVLKWARAGPAYAIPAADDFTKLTLDTISLCSMGFRFNSFYSEKAHPFVDAMSSFLIEGGRRSRRPAIVNSMMTKSSAKYQADVDTMKKISQGIIDERKARPSDTKDLLNAMLTGKDPKTGKGMDDDLIISNLITFLVAGKKSLK